MIRRDASQWTHSSRPRLTDAPAPRLFRANEPFPHLVINGLIPSHQLRTIARHLPDYRNCETRISNSPHVSNVGVVRSWDRLPRDLIQLIYNCASPPFITELEHLSGRYGLFLDLTLFSAGLHVFRRDCFMKPHAKMSQPHSAELHRELILWVDITAPKIKSKTISPTFQLWTHDLAEPQVEVLLNPGDALLFASSSNSYLGIIDRTEGKKHRDRTFLELNFFSAPRNNAKTVIP